MHMPAKHFEAWNLLWAPFPSILFKYLPANEKTRHDWPGFKEEQFDKDVRPTAP
jgi:hypothetical protein